MEMRTRPGYTAFEGTRRIASGELGPVAIEVRRALGRGRTEAVLVFDDATGEQVDVDLRGTDEELLARASTTPSGEPEERAEGEGPRGPGRPRLGVVAREVTLLPRHWEWLNGQPGGASVALRRLVDEARRANEGKDRVRRSREACYRFLSAVAGNLPGFEETARALFAGDRARFEEQAGPWPLDVAAYAKSLAAEAFPQAEGA